jgi:TolA-binding protein|tara:strand:- start:1063 stop:1473 length:411 start_codon:yes stop_codon:yes gene_type:complete
MEKRIMKVSDNTSIDMPIRNLLSIVVAVAIGVWAYFGVIARVTTIETSLVLAEKDLEKNTEFRIKWPRGEMGTLPADSEQYMLIEFMAEQLESMQAEMESMMSNTVNINFLKDQVSKLQSDVEQLKDKVRNNGTSH